MRVKPDIDILSNAGHLNTALKVTKNSVALFIVAFISKGVGLVTAVLVARHLGPTALGTYAVAMGFVVLSEAIVPLGQHLVIIREIARDRSRAVTYWMNASLMVLVISIPLGLALVSFAHLANYSAATLTSISALSLFIPAAGLFIIARSILQGLERMEYLSLASFLGSIVGVSTLWLLLEANVGVAAAFIANGFSYLIAFAVLAFVINRQVRFTKSSFCLDLDLCQRIIRVSLPFAIQEFFKVALVRVNTIVLPMLVTMETVGVFDAADRVQQASAMIIPMIIMSITPTLSRIFITRREIAITLLEDALKILLILVLPFAFGAAIAADRIIPLLYGAGYEAAVPVLRIVIWSMVFFIANVIFNQIMIASDNERPMMRRTGLTLAINIVLTLWLAPRYGALGIAWIAVLTQALNLGLNAQFVLSNVCRINLIKAAGKPFLCAALSGMVAFSLQRQGLIPALSFGAISHIAGLWVFQVFSPEEWHGLWHLSRQLLKSNHLAQDPIEPTKA